MSCPRSYTCLYQCWGCGHAPPTIQADCGCRWRSRWLFHRWQWCFGLGGSLFVYMIIAGIWLVDLSFNWYLKKWRIQTFIFCFKIAMYYSFVLHWYDSEINLLVLFSLVSFIFTLFLLVEWEPVGIRKGSAVESSGFVTFSPHALLGLCHPDAIQ